MFKGYYYNVTREITFWHKPSFILNINENNDSSFVPRFKLKETDIFDDFPANTPLKFSEALILKAIQYGMIIQVDYKGDEDDNFAGHERTIYPMTYGISKEGKPLLRVYHLNGWSVSKGGTVQKEWRLLRTDRILNMVFTGAFFRLPPDGYVTTDKSMQKVKAFAEFNQIRKLQQNLINSDTIESQDRVILNQINTVEAKDLNYNLKIFDPFANNVIPAKDAKNIRITFAKPIVGTGPYIAIIGTSIEPNNTFKLKVDSTVENTYKAVKWVMADELKALQNIESQVEFKLYMFLKGI